MKLIDATALAKWTAYHAELLPSDKAIILAHLVELDNKQQCNHAHFINHIGEYKGHSPPALCVQIDNAHVELWDRESLVGALTEAGISLDNSSVELKVIKNHCQIIEKNLAVACKDLIASGVEIPFSLKTWWDYYKRDNPE